MAGIGVEPMTSSFSGMRYYRLSYPAASPPLWLGAFFERRRDERSRHPATLVGLEPMTFGVTGRRSNQLSYRAISSAP